MSVDITQLTAHLSHEQQEAVKKAYKSQAENPTAAFLFCFFLGIFGAHRFYLRQWRQGWLHLILPILIVIVVVGGLLARSNAALVAAIIIAIVLLLIALIWEIIDLFSIDQEVYAHNLKLAEQLIARTLLADTSIETAGQMRLDQMVLASEERAEEAELREEGATAAAAAAAVPPIAAAAEESASGAMGASEAVDAAAEQKTDSGFGYSTDSYSATTTREISADPNETKQETEQEAEEQRHPQSWGDTETTEIDDVQSDSSEKEGSEALAEPSAAGAAAVAAGLGVAGGMSFLESLSHEHDEGNYTVTDSSEQIDTDGEAEATQRDEVGAAESEAEADPNAVTWPDHPPVQPDKPEPVVAEAVAAGAAAGGIAALASLGDETATSAPVALDYTDMGALTGDAAPVADIATADAAPLYVMLPEPPAPAPAPTPEPAASHAPEIAGAAAVAGLSAVAFTAAEDSSSQDAGVSELQLVPETESASVAQQASASTTGEVAPPEYIPPTAPIVTVGDASDNVVPVVTEAIIEPVATEPVITESAVTETVSATPVSAPEPVAAEDTSAAAAEETHGPSGETLAALAGLAGTAGVIGAAEIIHHEHEEAPAAPAQVAEPAPSAAEAAQPADTATQHEDETVATGGAAAVAEAAGGTDAAQPHRQLRRVRVKREYKVGDQVIETTYAEELIPIDADPEPVRERLQAYLHQQADARERQARGES